MAGSRSLARVLSVMMGGKSWGFYWSSLSLFGWDFIQSSTQKNGERIESIFLAEFGICCEINEANGGIHFGLDEEILLIQWISIGFCGV